MQIPATQINAAGIVEYDYVERTTTLTVSNTAIDDANTDIIVTGNAVSYSGSTVILIEFYAPFVSIQHANVQNVVVNLYDGSTDLGRLVNIQNQTGATELVGVTASRRLTPSSGSHTYSIRVWKTTALAVAQVGAGAGGTATYLPSFMRITKAS